jgi:hypothetical protein
VTKEYTDFSDTELLIQAGRAEASEVIRLYGLHEFVRDPPTPRPFVDRGLGGGAGPDGGPEGDGDDDGEAGAPRPVPEAAGPDADAQSSGDPGGVAGANRTTSS